MAIQKLTFIFIVLAPLVTPIGYNGAMMPDLYRGAYFQIGILFLVALWFFQQINLKKRQIIRSHVEIPILLFLAWATLSLLWVDDYFEAFKLLTIWWCAGLLYFLVTQIFRDRRSIETLSMGIVISGFLVSLLGVGQYLFGLDWIAQTVKPAATFGNKNMAVHFLVMVIPLSIGLLLHVRQKNQQMIIAACLLPMMLFLFYANSRAGLLALLAEIALFTLFILKNRKNRLRSTQYIVVIAAILIPSLIAGFGYRSVEFSDRFSEVYKGLSKDYRYANPRVSMWMNTLAMAKDNPALGVGAGNWRIHYPHYLDSTVRDKSMNEARMHQHAHNDWLEILSSLGIVGIVLLIWIMFMIGRLIYRHLSSHQDFLVLGLLAGLVGLLVDGFFTFPLKLAIAPLMLATFIALLAALTQSDQNKQVLPLPLPLAVAAMSLFLLSGVWSVVKNGQHLKAQVHYSNSLVYQRDGSYDRAKIESVKSVNLNPGQALYRFTLSAVLLRLKEYNDAIRHGSLILEKRPYHFPTIAVMAQAFLAAQRQDEALEYLERLAGIMKTHKLAQSWLPVLYAQKTKEQITRQDYLSLEQTYRKWADITPTANIYQNLAVILYNHLNRQEEGVKYFQKALNLDPNLPQAERVRALIQRHKQKQ